MIKLNDILHFSTEQISKAKVKFNKTNGIEEPIELYKNNPDIINKQWLYWRKKQHYFSVGQIAICLIKISEEHWLLTTVDTVVEDLGVNDGVNYIGVPFVEYASFYGRTIIRFHKTFQTQGVNLETILDELEVAQILPDTFDDDDFPGYDNVKLSYARLRGIIERGRKDWIGALENQKAVYLLTDTSNGKLYVGSATSDNGMLLQRWKSYVINGHGGNKELRRLVEDKGFSHIKQYFQYTILENFNAKVDDHMILQREAWWKDALQTREFGYNDN